MVIINLNAAIESFIERKFHVKNNLYIPFKTIDVLQLNSEYSKITIYSSKRVKRNCSFQMPS